MNEELEYYSKLADWDFNQINYKEEILTDWNFFNCIKRNTNETSLCLDLGTGGGEKVLNEYPDVGMVIATDFSKNMINTAEENAIKYPKKKVKFCEMNSLKMNFPDNLFNLVSARHTKIDAKQIYKTLAPNGVLVIEGIDKKDCWDLKEIFKRGQGYRDKKSISEKDYEDVVNAGFSKIEKVEILINEYYETKDDLMKLILKTPIIYDFGEIENGCKLVDIDLFNEYVKRFKTNKGILLKRALYGIVAKK